MNRKFPLILVVGLAAFFAMGFSPYEMHLRAGLETHVGLFAELTKAEQFAPAFKALDGKDAQERLAKEGISGVQAFTRRIGGKNYVVVYFAFEGGKSYLGAAEAFEKATASSAWAAMLRPLPRAVRDGRTWLQMEWVSFIRGMDVDRKPTSSVMIGTTLRPEKEMEYRALHQAVWPGVVDQIARGKNRNLSIFLVEEGELLLKFLYVEYMGDDEEKDGAANLADPVNQRWWKLTDACQKPFSDVKEGIWAPLEAVK